MKIKRRWFQFSIGFLMLLVSLVVAGLVLWRARVDPQRGFWETTLLGALAMYAILLLAVWWHCRRW